MVRTWCMWLLTGAALMCVVDAAHFLVMPRSLPSHTAYFTKLTKGLLNNGSNMITYHVTGIDESGTSV